MRGRLAHSIVRYYVALRLSAVAASAAWPAEQLPEPPPAVRVARATLTDAERERWVAADGRIGVVTLPHSYRRGGATSTLCLN